MRDTEPGDVAVVRMTPAGSMGAHNTLMIRESEIESILLLTEGVLAGSWSVRTKSGEDHHVDSEIGWNVYDGWPAALSGGKDSTDEDVFFASTSLREEVQIRETTKQCREFLWELQEVGGLGLKADSGTGDLGNVYFTDGVTLERIALNRLRLQKHLLGVHLEIYCGAHRAGPCDDVECGCRDEERAIDMDTLVTWVSPAETIRSRSNAHAAPN